MKSGDHLPGIPFTASGGRLIRELGINICEVDKLFHEIQPITRSPVALRVFCRALQKHFEKGGRL